MASSVQKKDAKGQKPPKIPPKPDQLMRSKLHRFPSDSDIYRKGFYGKKATSNIHRKFSSTSQLNKLPLKNCKHETTEDTLPYELIRFYFHQVREKREQILHNKRLAFSVVFKLLINAQIINDRFTVVELLKGGPRYGEMAENESDWFEFSVPIYLEDNTDIFIHRAEEDGFVRVQAENCTNWADCVDSEGLLSASLVRSNLQLTMQNALNNLHENIRQEKDEFPADVESVAIFCDGSTIVLDVNRGYIMVDLIPTIQIPNSCVKWCRRFSKTEARPPSHIVGKSCVFPLSNPETLWQLSFALAERTQINQLNVNQLRMLYILAEIRERDEILKEVSFYQVQTILFHVIEKTAEGTKWTEAHMAARFMDTMTCLETFLQEKNCPHYFMKDANLFAFTNSVTMSKLKDRARRIMKPTCKACSVAALFGKRKV